MSMSWRAAHGEHYDPNSPAAAAAADPGGSGSSAESQRRRRTAGEAAGDWCDDEVEAARMGGSVLSASDAADHKQHAPQHTYTLVRRGRHSAASTVVLPCSIYQAFGTCKAFGTFV